jgi:hypothetical protein
VVETGGLENRCTGNRTGGSNPSPSATQSELQRNSARLAPKYANNVRISRLFPHKPDYGERTARSEGDHYRGFSPEGTLAVRFQAGIRRMQCDQKIGIRP